MILISPSPARDYDKRRWDGFVELIDAIIEKHDPPDIMIVGTEDQRYYVRDIIDDLDGYYSKIWYRVANLCGKTNIHELAHLVRDAELLITVNTFTMHLASALNTPCVCVCDALSAPIVAHPNVRQVIMPCTVDEVMEAVDEVLG
jgi:ADP-heptose:LPS heptosyltransferase